MGSLCHCFSHYRFGGRLLVTYTINTTQYCDTKVVVLTSKFGIVGIDYAV